MFCVSFRSGGWSRLILLFLVGKPFRCELALLCHGEFSAFDLNKRILTRLCFIGVKQPIDALAQQRYVGLVVGDDGRGESGHIEVRAAASRRDRRRDRLTIHQKPALQPP